MAAGWVGAGIAKSEVEGDQSSLVGDGSGEHVGIGSAGQLLVGNGIDVVAESEKRIRSVCVPDVPPTSSAPICRLVATVTVYVPFAVMRTPRPASGTPAGLHLFGLSSQVPLVGLARDPPGPIQVE